MPEVETMTLRKFVAPEFVFCVGARALAGRHARNLGGRRVLVVSDPGVVAAGWTGQVITALEEAGIEPVPFTDVTPNPRDHEVAAGAAR
jgi:alcohol dehydrogenase class IV